MINEQLHRPPYLSVQRGDYLFSGREELYISTDRFGLLFSPRLGGSLWELSWREGAVNFLDTFTRRPEPYHQEYLDEAAAPPGPEERVASIHHRRAVKEEGILERLFYDPYPRGALIEHFFREESSPGEFEKGEGLERGYLARSAGTEVERLPARGDHPGEGVRVTFRREGGLAQEQPVQMEKTVTLYGGEDSLQVDYHLLNEREAPASFHFGVEFNLAFLSGSDEERYYLIPGRELEDRLLGSRGAEEAVKEISLIDRRRDLTLTLSWSKPALLWRMPVETISNSEDGLERSYQQSLLLPRWRIELDGGGNWAVSLQLQVSRVAGSKRQALLAGKGAQS